MDQDTLEKLLEYDAERNVFVWRRREDDGTRGTRIFNTRWAGKEAGSAAGAYNVIRICERNYRAHKLAHLYMQGRYPDRPQAQLSRDLYGR